MRLCATGRTVRRTWTVELRPQHGGTLMACPQCPTAGRLLPLEPSAVRSTVVAHLAGHARRDALPTHLRTCQCHERGCPWHPRHRGCSGPIMLVLTRERGGRLWRLTDACNACAQTTAHSAIVPEATMYTTTPQAASPRHRKRRERGPGAAVRVQEMLSYLAAALPRCTAAPARLLAVQCALRATASGRLWTPWGLLRGMRMGSAFPYWEELEQAQWLRRLPTLTSEDARGVSVQLLDATILTQTPTRRDRARAADWALRMASHPALRGMPVVSPLVALTLAAHSSLHSCRGLLEANRFTHMCALSPGLLADVLDDLVSVGALMSWSYDSATEDIAWALPTLLTGYRSAGERGQQCTRTGSI